MELKININKITRIYIYPEREKSNRFVWNDAQPKTFWSKAKLEGFKDNSDWEDDHRYSVDEILSKGHRYLVEDRIVYIKPRIEIDLSNNSEETIYFNTLQELNDFIQSNGFNNKNFIKIVK